MQRQASSNWRSSAWALAKYDKYNVIQNVDPVDRMCGNSGGDNLDGIGGFTGQAKKPPLQQQSERLPDEGVFFLRQRYDFL